MRLIIDEKAIELGIRNPSAAIIRPVQIKQGFASELEPSLQDVNFVLEQQFEALVGSPEALGFRKLFSRMGYDTLMPAGERLVKAFKERGFRSINNIVDAYNIVSAKYCSGIGLHDSSKISGDIVLTLASGQERVKPMFKNGYKNIKAGDLIYRCDDNILAWLGKNDVDSDDFKVTPETTEVIVFALGNAETSREFNDNIIKEIYENIRHTCRQAKMFPLECAAPV